MSHISYHAVFEFTRNRFVDLLYYVDVPVSVNGIKIRLQCRSKTAAKPPL